MEKSAAAAAPRWARATSGAVYWAVFQRIPAAPIVMGSHYGVRVDCDTDCSEAHGHVYSSEAAALARLAILPKNYSKGGQEGAGAPIGWEVGRVLHNCGYFYDVQALEVSQLRPGHRVMTGQDYWQTVDSIEFFQHVGGREAGADVYRVAWRDVLAADPNAAPSLLSSRSRYDVLRTDY
jgi:hypothetical protein